MCGVTLMQGMSSLSLFLSSFMLKHGFQTAVPVLNMWWKHTHNAQVFYRSDMTWVAIQNKFQIQVTVAWKVKWVIYQFKGPFITVGPATGRSLTPLVCMLKVPWARYWTLSWPQCIYISLEALWHRIKHLYKCVYEWGKCSCVKKTLWVLKYSKKALYKYFFPLSSCG